VPKLWSETIDAHRHAVREAIIDATAAFVARHGLRAVTMSDVAHEAGIGRATLYKYFSDADAILRAWHDREVRGHVEQLTAARDRADGARERLEAVLDAYARLSNASHAAPHDADLAASLHRDERVASAQRDVRHLLMEVLEAAVATGDVRDDVPPDELAGYCLHALAAASRLRSKAAISRLVEVTIAGLRPVMHPVPPLGSSR
jgi:AcrR family transcriptional regulator